MPLRVQGRQKRGAIWYRMCPISKPVGKTASPNAIAPRAGNVQFLGEMPWEAGRLRSSPTSIYMGDAGAEVNLVVGDEAHGNEALPAERFDRYCGLMPAASTRSAFVSISLSTSL